VHDRKLMREAQGNLAIRWFAGYRVDERLPHHSSLTRIRQRGGVQRFRRIFQRTVKACVEAGLVEGETVHVDATRTTSQRNYRMEPSYKQHTAVRWGLTNMAIQPYLTAAVINLKRLAHHSGLNGLCERLVCAVKTAHNGLLAIGLEIRSVGVCLRLAPTRSPHREEFFNRPTVPNSPSAVVTYRPKPHLMARLKRSVGHP